MLYDITEVCNMLGITSRTLRFYESEGLIESTTKPPSLRRYYSENQIDTIKKVLAFRALGLSIKKIKELFADKYSLEEALLSQRIDIIRLITEKQRQINLLEEVLHNLEFGRCNDNAPSLEIFCSDRQLEISAICTDAILHQRYKTVLQYFSDDMKVVLPETALARSIEISTKPLGIFRKHLPAFRDKKAPNIIIHPLEYENHIFRLKYVFHEETIHGFWTDYMEQSKHITP